MTCVSDAGGWHSVCARWAACPWRGAGALVSRVRLRAAYGCALVAEPRRHAHHRAQDALDALAATQFNFVEDEVILAVWMCYVGRGHVQCREGTCAGACAALLSRWVDPPRRSLLRFVTMQSDNDRPTLGHRLLCRLAQCIITPSEAATRAYEAACQAMGNTYNDVMTWGTSPTLDRLPRLACRLYPKHTVYFELELELASDTTSSE
ncbi:hypothetical protein O3G_MSEX001995 [Manduca sexta]|uniref:Uncharacterized protein n=1 Tax=Manduca sexta TaxID=7130 RepID=A0A921YMA2_MANSE|nr:hypothetical protein O3G_MSEX001995 [Manduca sexta]